MGRHKVTPYVGRPKAIQLGTVHMRPVWPRNPQTGMCAPTPMQATIASCPSKHVGVVGGSGSGKSLTGAIIFLEWLLAHPGITGLVVGKDYSQLKGVQWKVLMKVLKWWGRVNGVDLVRTASMHAKKIELFNGSTIILRSSTEIERIQGLQVQIVWCDEWAIWSDQRSAWNEIHARLRDDDGRPLKGIWTSTPKGSYGIAALFQDKCRVEVAPKVWRSEHSAAEQPAKGYSLFQMSTRDNPVLGDDYVSGLEGNYSTDEALAEIDGEILTLAGSVFGHVFSLIHNVIPFKFDPQKHPLTACIDHGANYPYVGLWAEFTDAAGEPADILISEFVKDGVRGVQDLIWWTDAEMVRLRVAKLAAIYPDPDKQYVKENMLLQTHYKCAVHAYETKDYRAISWGTGLVKARLCDAKGGRHLFISKDVSAQQQNQAVNGRGLIRGFQTQEWAEKKGRNIQEDLADVWKDMRGTHACDATRYKFSHQYRYLAANGMYKKGVGGMKIYK